MDKIVEFLDALWYTWLEMGPYLFAGFIIAGILHIWLDNDKVFRLLGKRGPNQVVRAVLLGVPLPVCSCGVIPISSTLREKGAGPGATAGFMLTTPQTGIDSVYATWGILGGPLAVFRVFAATISGIAAGFAADYVSDTRDSEAPESPKKASCGCSDVDKSPSESTVEKPVRSKLKESLKFSLVTLPRDVFWPILIGVLIAAIAQVWLPTNFWGNLNLPTWIDYLLVIAISLPVYVCSTGAIPVAWTLVMAGMSPGAVLIFLVAGPASNAGTFSMLVRTVGSRAALAALGTLSGLLLLTGIIIDLMALDLFVGVHGHHHDAGHHSMGIPWIQVLLALAALFVFLPPFVLWFTRKLVNRRSSQTSKSCCQS